MLRRERDRRSTRDDGISDCGRSAIAAARSVRRHAQHCCGQGCELRAVGANGEHASAAFTPSALIRACVRTERWL